MWSKEIFPRLKNAVYVIFSHLHWIFRKQIFSVFSNSQIGLLNFKITYNVTFFRNHITQHNTILWYLVITFFEKTNTNEHQTADHWTKSTENLIFSVFSRMIRIFQKANKVPNNTSKNEISQFWNTAENQRFRIRKNRCEVEYCKLDSKFCRKIHRNVCFKTMCILKCLLQKFKTNFSSH
jgi:hypothetical protein